MTLLKRSTFTTRVIMVLPRFSSKEHFPLYRKDRIVASPPLWHHARTDRKDIWHDVHAAYVRLASNVLWHCSTAVDWQLYSISVDPCSAVKDTGILCQYEPRTRLGTVAVRNATFVKQAVGAKLSSFSSLFCVISALEPCFESTDVACFNILRVWRVHYFMLAWMDYLCTSLYLPQCCVEFLT